MQFCTDVNYGVCVCVCNCWKRFGTILYVSYLGFGAKLHILKRYNSLTRVWLYVPAKCPCKMILENKYMFHFKSRQRRFKILLTGLVSCVCVYLSLVRFYIRLDSSPNNYFGRLVLVLSI